MNFLKDKSIGLKDLSMPDRITNTINTINKGTIYRPSVISSFNSNINLKNIGGHYTGNHICLKIK